MNMKRLSFSLELGLFILAFLIGAALRLARVGAIPLTNSEADLALQALNLAHGQETLLSPHPLYLVLTAASMFLFGSGNLVARLWPALAGSLLIWVPFLYRDRLGRVPALFAAFFLAVDPAMLAISRQIGSPVFAVSLSLLAAGLLYQRRYAWGGIVAGLALLGGPWVWQGMIILGISMWISSGWQRKPETQEPGEQVPVTSSAPAFFRSSFLSSWRPAVIAGLAALLLAGTFFFAIPNGLTAFAAGLPAYFVTWIQSSGVTEGTMTSGLLSYEFLPVLLGLAAILFSWELPVTRFFAVWFLVGLLVAAVPPGREVSSLVWVIPPVWGLAGILIDRVLRQSSEDRLLILGQALLSIVILTFLSLDLLSITGMFASGLPQSGDWLGLAGAVILLVATTLLVAWGWSWRVAALGLLWGVMALFFVYTFAQSWDAAHLSARPETGYWSAGPAFKDADLLDKTIRELALTNVGARDRLEITVIGISPPSLRWALRDQQRVSFVDLLSPNSAPQVVITPYTQEVSLSKQYRGELFILEQEPVLNFSSPAAWFSWLVYRNTQMENSQIILWAQTDLFPGSDTPSSSTAP